MPALTPSESPRSSALTIRTRAAAISETEALGKGERLGKPVVPLALGRGPGSAAPSPATGSPSCRRARSSCSREKATRRRPTRRRRRSPPGPPRPIAADERGEIDQAGADGGELPVDRARRAARAARRLDQHVRSVELAVDHGLRQRQQSLDDRLVALAEPVQAPGARPRLPRRPRRTRAPAPSSAGSRPRRGRAGARPRRDARRPPRARRASRPASAPPPPRALARPPGRAPGPRPTRRRASSGRRSGRPPTRSSAGCRAPRGASTERRPRSRVADRGGTAAWPGGLARRARPSSRLKSQPSSRRPPARLELLEREAGPIFRGPAAELAGRAARLSSRLPARASPRSASVGLESTPPSRAA